MIGTTVIATATVLAAIVAWSAAKELRLLRKSGKQTPLRLPFATLLVLRIVTAGVLLDALIHLFIAPNWRDPFFLSLVGIAFLTYVMGNVALYVCIGIAAGNITKVRISRAHVIRTTVVFVALGICLGVVATLSAQVGIAELTISGLVATMTVGAIGGLALDRAALARIRRRQATSKTKSDTRELSAYDYYESEPSILKRIGIIARQHKK